MANLNSRTIGNGMKTLHSLKYYQKRKKCVNDLYFIFFDKINSFNYNE